MMDAGLSLNGRSGSAAAKLMSGRTDDKNGSQLAAATCVPTSRKLRSGRRLS
jgi:hypothetical protein